MIVVIGTLDTKGEKVAYLKQQINKKGIKTFVIDSGVLGKPYLTPDISRQEVARSAGKTIDYVSSLHDEAKAMDIMTDGVTNIVYNLFNSGQLDGLVGVGGTMGTALFLSVASKLPLGIPKVLFTTVNSGFYLKSKLIPPDLIIIPAVSDIWGISDITKLMLDKATGTIIGTSQIYRENGGIPEKKYVGMTTLGTSCLKYIEYLIPILEKRSYNVLLFHIGGGQGITVEQLIKQGIIKGMLDLCLLDVCPGNLEKIGFYAVPQRLTSAIEMKIPLLVAPGGIEFYSYAGLIEEVPRKYKMRRWHRHNDLAVGIERSRDETIKTAHFIASKLNRATGPVVFALPMKGFSDWSKKGAFFYDPERENIFIEALKSKLKSNVKLVELNMHINDPEFSHEVASIFDSLMK